MKEPRSCDMNPTSCRGNSPPGAAGWQADCLEILTDASHCPAPQRQRRPSPPGGSQCPRCPRRPGIGPWNIAGRPWNNCPLLSPRYRTPNKVKPDPILPRIGAPGSGSITDRFQPATTTRSVLPENPDRLCNTDRLKTRCNLATSRAICQTGGKIRTCDNRQEAELPTRPRTPPG